MSSDEETGSLIDEYSDTSYEDDDKHFQPEMGAFDRVGFNDFDGTTPKTRLEHATQEPIERFKQYVKGVTHDLKSKNIHITNSQIREMIDSADQLKNVEHKNPTAYVLGFLANKMEIDDLDDFGDLYDYVIKKVLIHVVDPEDSVQAHDVIRYGRLWNSMLSKK
jgi:hypothetical protein